jgi:Tfp pilus assembly protein PilF
MVFSCGSMEDKKTKYFERGNAFFEKDDYVKARMEFKNAIQIDPRYAEAYYMLGMVEYRKMNGKEPLVIFRRQYIMTRIFPTLRLHWVMFY